jgi:iron complex outermembrane recepter protein
VGHPRQAVSIFIAHSLFPYIRPQFLKAVMGNIMRVSICAVVLCLSVIGLSFGDSAQASIRKVIDIRPQGLGPALNTFAKDRDLQVVYRSEVVGALQTRGAVGDLTVDEALKQLLGGTGLTYRFLDARTVTVFPAGESSDTKSPTADAHGLSDGPNSSQEARRSANGIFRLAQVGQGSAGQSASASTAPNSTEGANKEEIDEILVTAQKRSERVQDVPISISVLSGSRIDDSSLVSITDALNTVPGVVAQTGVMGGGTQIGIRGVGASGPLFNGSSPIGYYLDSIPFGLVKTAVAPDEDAYDLQRIEVLRGPQGTLYGASAEGGLVRVLTNDANLNEFELKARTTVSTTDGGGENYRGDMAVNVPVIDGKLAVRAVVGYENLSGWINTSNETHANDGTLRNYRVKIDAQPTDELAIGLSEWSTRNNYGAPNTAVQNGKTSEATLPQPINTDFDATGLKISYSFPSLVVSSMTSFLHYENGGLIDLGSDGLPGVGIYTDVDSRVFTEEWNLTSVRSDDWRWSAGAFYRHGKDSLIQGFSVFSSVLNAGTDGSSSSAVFGELGRRFYDETFGWTLGLRYFHDDVYSLESPLQQQVLGGALYDKSASFNATTPRAVLSWYPNSQVTVYGSYSQGFRSGFPQNPAVGITYPNFPALKPDKLNNFEVGAKANLFDGRLSWDSSLYYIDWRDVQQTLTVPYQSTIVTAVVNGQSASGLGADLALTVRPLNALDIGVSISWNDLSLDKNVYSGGILLFAKGDRLNYSSAYTGGVFSDYSFPLARGWTGKFSASANYSSGQDDRGIGTTSAWVSVGSAMLISRVSASFTSPYHLMATVFVDNANNENGGFPAVSTQVDFYPHVRPRTAGLQLDYHY